METVSTAWQTTTGSSITSSSHSLFSDCCILPHKQSADQCSAAVSLQTAKSYDQQTVQKNYHSTSSKPDIPPQVTTDHNGHVFSANFIGFGSFFSAFYLRPVACIRVSFCAFQVFWCIWIFFYFIRHRYSTGNTTEENFSLIGMCQLPSARACRQYNFAPTKSSSS